MLKFIKKKFDSNKNQDPAVNDDSAMPDDVVPHQLQQRPPTPTDHVEKIEQDIAMMGGDKAIGFEH